MSRADYSRVGLAWLKYKWLLRYTVAVPGLVAIVLGTNAAYWPRWVEGLLDGEIAVSVRELTEPAAVVVQESPLTGVSLIIIGILAVALAVKI